MAKAEAKEKKTPLANAAPEGYLWAQKHAVRLDQSSSLLQMIPSILFSCIVILFVHAEYYSRPMTQFYWTSDTDESTITDFFSMLKMEVILGLACIAILMIVFRLITETMSIKRTWLYIPMIVYAAFVVISYIGSSYKEFALLGYNDRFEGTLPLLAYMLILFLIINSVNTEKNVKMILWPLAIVTVILSLIGISQATGHDFFQTVIGQKLITQNTVLQDGSTVWQQIEAAAAQGERYLNFTFKNNEIYQTVYNINYVSFYLTLLVPIFGMLFLRSCTKGSDEPIWKKIAFGVLLALIIFNLIGSKSSGGYFGLAVMVVLALIMFNKQLAKWWKPLLVVLVILGVVLGLTTNIWLPEVKSVFIGLKSGDTKAAAADAALSAGSETAEPASVKPVIDYFKTNDDCVETSINGNYLKMALVHADDGSGEIRFTVFDESGADLPLIPMDAQDGSYYADDERFLPYVKFSPLMTEDGDYAFVMSTLDYNFRFVELEGHMFNYNPLGYYIDLEPIERAGFFKDKPNFGSGRGNIWSHTVPLLKHTIFKGVGADCTALVYPHNDYAYEYSVGPTSGILQIVDKPHCMYLHMAVGTGCISLLAILTLYIGYLIQCIRLYWKRNFDTDYMSYVGVGIFLGITGFLFSALVDDSTVSVMPMFYSLLGMGIAINIFIKRRDAKAFQPSK